MESPVDTPVVIDIGEAYVKVGFAGDQQPRYIFPCITGIEKYKSVMVDVGQARGKTIYVGDDCMKMRGVLKVSRPISRGNIVEWENYYEVLNHIFYNLLRIEPSEYDILYIEPVNLPRESKEYIARVLFETHKFRKIMMMPSPILSLFSVGLTTGLVIESGEGLTNIVPIIDGKIYFPGMQILQLAGADVGFNLKSLLMRQGISVESQTQREIFRGVIEKFCYVALDPNSINPAVKADKTDFDMPDGRTIQIDNESMYLSPEILFEPSMLGYNVESVPNAVLTAMRNINSEYWGTLLGNIVVSGGNSSYNGYIERLKAEILALLPQLGPIPTVKQQPQKVQVKQLVSQDTPTKYVDSCEKCGNIVDLTGGIKFCPFCGSPIGAPSIDIGIDIGGKVKAPKISKGKCPFCNQELPKDKENQFCPFCGKNLQALDVPEISDAPEMQIDDYADTPTSGPAYYENLSDLVKFYIPDNLQHAIFTGGAILASLSTFRSLFIDQNQFNLNPNLLYRDISELF